MALALSLMFRYLKALCNPRSDTFGEPSNETRRLPWCQGFIQLLSDIMYTYKRSQYCHRRLMEKCAEGWSRFAAI